MSGTQMVANVPLEARRVRSTDGTSIAYQITRRPFEGAPRIVLASGLGGHRVAWRAFIEHFADRFQIVTWDYRGLFDSARPAGGSLAAYGIDAHARDLAAILDAEGWSRASLVGWSMGVQVVLEAHRARPDLAESLILLNGSPGRPLEAPSSIAAVRALLPRLVALAHRLHRWTGRVTRGAALSPSAGAWLRRLGLVAPVVDAALLAKLLRGLAELDMDAYFSNLRAAGEHDASDVLPGIDVPVLLVAGGRDRTTPPAIAHQMARALARVSVLVVPRGTHYTPVEYPELLHVRIDRFFDEAGIGREGRGALVATAAPVEG